MQRLTRYSLLLGAIAKKTTEQEEKKNLDKIVRINSNRRNGGERVYITAQHSYTSFMGMLACNSIEEQMLNMQYTLSAVVPFPYCGVPWSPHNFFFMS